jgi:hypothetical protein
MVRFWRQSVRRLIQHVRWKAVAIANLTKQT